MESKNKLLLVSAVFILLSLSACPISADIYISEVLYNPLLTESGGEAVELYNSGNMAMNISGYTIQTASSDSDALLPSNAIIPANGYYLIADASWSTKRDSPLFPYADHEESITLLNTNSGVALLDPSKNTLDKVGWGDMISIDPQLYSGIPTNYTPNGYSIQRTGFTSDNHDDFISAEPDFTNSLAEDKPSGTNAVDISIEIRDFNGMISNLSANFDYSNKVMLYPKRQRQLNITFMIDSSAAFDSLELVFNNTEYPVLEGSNYGNKKSYLSTIPIDFYFAPGNYTLSTIAFFSGQEVVRNLSLEIMPLLAFEIDLSSLNCSITSQQLCEIDGDSDMSTEDSPTIRNLGNSGLDFKVYASNFSGNGNNMDISYLKISFDDNEQYSSLRNSPELFDTNLIEGENSLMPFSLMIQVPSSAPKGLYNTRLIFLGVSDGN